MIDKHFLILPCCREGLRQEEIDPFILTHRLGGGDATLSQLSLRSGEEKKKKFSVEFNQTYVIFK